MCALTQLMPVPRLWASRRGRATLMSRSMPDLGAAPLARLMVVALAAILSVRIRSTSLPDWRASSTPILSPPATVLIFHCSKPLQWDESASWPFMLRIILDNAGSSLKATMSKSIFEEIIATSLRLLSVDVVPGLHYGKVSGQRICVLKCEERGAGTGFVVEEPTSRCGLSP